MTIFWGFVDSLSVWLFFQSSRRTFTPNRTPSASFINKFITGYVPWYDNWPALQIVSKSNQYFLMFKPELNIMEALGRHLKSFRKTIRMISWSGGNCSTSCNSVRVLKTEKQPQIQIFNKSIQSVNRCVSG